LVSLIFGESQGNLFLVEEVYRQEVYRHLTEDGKIFDAAGELPTDIKIDETGVPKNVRLIIGRRLERLDGNEKRVLAAAAVIGRGFSFQLLTATCQIDVDELFTVIEKTQQMGIIVPSSEGPQRPFTFAHEVTRQTLLAGISPPRRQHLHGLVADAIEQLYPDAANEHAGDIADHLLKAGSFADRQRLVRWLKQADNNALEASAFEEASRSFQSTLSHLTVVDGRERAEPLARLAIAKRGLELWNAALAHLEEALGIHIHLGDRAMIARSFIDSHRCPYLGWPLPGGNRISTSQTHSSSGQGLR
jgi:predicted ATPase